MSNSIFQQALNFTQQRFPIYEPTCTSLLFGYAKLVSMNDGVLKILFAKEEEMMELAEIKSKFQKERIDVELLKQAVPLLLRGQDIELEKARYKGILSRHKEDEAFYALRILQGIFNEEIEALNYIRIGGNLDEAFAYMDAKKSDGQNAKPELGATKPEMDATKKVIRDRVEGSKQDSEAIPKGEKNEEKTAIKSVDLSKKRQRFQQLTKETTELYDRLMCKVMGQNEAVRTFVQGYFQSEILIDEEVESNRPSATFLFAGPPGVGKTFLSSSAAELLKRPYKRFDMSEYAMASAVDTLIGTAKVYKGAKPGQLTDFVHNNPNAILLFDEIEKACDQVIYQFLQILDGGMITDVYENQEVSFRQTILIFTTNVGKSLYENRDRLNLASLPRAVVMRAIEEEKDNYGAPCFPPAICSRFSSGNLVMFNHLAVNNLIDIINDNFNSCIKRFNQGYGFEVDIDRRIASMLLFANSSNLDARFVSAQSAIMIKNEIYEFARRLPDLSAQLSQIDKICFRMDLDNSEEKIQELFTNNQLTDILYIGEESKLKDMPFSNRCRVHCAKDWKEVRTIMEEKDIAFALIDVFYGMKDNEKQYLALDDRESEGIACLSQLREGFAYLPVYLVDYENIGHEDRNAFLEKGVRGFVDMENPLECSDTIAKISDTIYMQKKVDELSGKGRTLSYSTAQRINRDNREAELVFYDFKMRMATSSVENRMMVADQDRPKDRFNDVIGAEDAKKELQYFVDYMKNPKQYLKKSIKPPKGILLYGPPGTGKTMLARAMAGECEIPFFSTSASGFQRKYVGEGEKHIQQLFKTAKKFAPSIIFIDEIDAIGRERTGSETTHYTEGLLNILLTEMDGFEVDPSRPVFVIAATNYGIDGSSSLTIDEALLRRFDNRIYVDLPKEKEREIFLEQQLGKVQAEYISSGTIHSIAQRTTGESLAIIKNVIELALRNAGREGRNLTDEDLLNALEEYMYGEKRDWDDAYYRSVSIHEAGHAYVYSLSGKLPSFVTIVSRGDFGGYMAKENGEDTPCYTKEQLIWNIRTALAGRAAELEFFGEEQGINTGASSDLKNATNIVMNMLCRYGMDGEQLMSMPIDQFMGNPKGEKLLERANEILVEELQQTRELVRQGRDKIKGLADYLVENNQATQNQVQEIFQK